MPPSPLSPLDNPPLVHDVSPADTDIATPPNTSRTYDVFSSMDGHAKLNHLSTMPTPKLSPGDRLGLLLPHRSLTRTRDNSPPRTPKGHPIDSRDFFGPRVSPNPRAFVADVSAHLPHLQSLCIWQKLEHLHVPLPSPAAIPSRPSHRLLRLCLWSRLPEPSRLRGSRRVAHATGLGGSASSNPIPRSTRIPHTAIPGHDGRARRAHLCE